VASGLYSASLTVNRSGGAVMYYTGLVVSIIPVVILFIVFADKLLKNLSIGGLKG
jgi:ABC-type maltose transport system permease subunit